ncbi:SRPBCC domain-containing protein [Chitinophaga sp. GCM10012297]|uniref:SRPBCC domain-containing protein n=1 Tax=Chitinophaga chungangae TaxID=2821488 RepID=A0ABS3YIP7_9BACT|nr:SRPBCC domain-containing protein [Chitinophaga chungangae]MBO9154537.1 SRPBCC domain-containing protein [Chitinophaga chungangae]
MKKETKADRSVDITRSIHSPVKAVWKALTDAKELERWFPLKANVTGGEIQLSWGDDVNWHMEIEEVKEEEYLRLGYGESHHRILSAVPRRLAVEFFLQGEEDVTTLRIVHNGFGGDESWDEMYDGVRRGWGTESLALKHYLENHAGKDRIVAFASISSAGPFEQLWNKLFGNRLKTAGDHYTIDTPVGETYEGRLLFYNPPQDLLGTMENFHDALFRLSIERFSPGGDIFIWIWIAAYGVAEEKMKELEKQWQEKLNAIYHV